MILRDLGAPFRLRSTVTRTSGVAASLRLARRARFALRLAVACVARCVRPTSASQHIHYEHPRLARSRAVERLEEFGVSRRRDSLRRAEGPTMRGVLFPATGLRLRLWRSCRVSRPPGLLLFFGRAELSRDAKIASTTSLVKGS